MRVLLAAYTVSPTRGSEPGSSWRLAAGLAERGHDVELLTTKRFDDEWSHSEMPDRLTITSVDDSVPGLLNRGQVGVYLRYLAWQRRSVAVARGIHRAQSVDVVHHYSWGSLVWGSPLWRLDLPFVFGPVGGGSVAPPKLLGVMSSRAGAQERLRSVVTGLMRFNVRTRRTLRTAMVFAANSDTQRLIEQLGSTSSQLLMPEQTPPDLLRTEPVPLEGRRRGHLIWIGRLMPRKGAVLAVEALRELPAEVSLTVVGGGPELDRARERAESLALEDRVRFVGPIPWADVAHELDQATALLFTSVRDTTGAQLLEAGARGTPIVALAHQGVADYVPESAGVLVPVGSPRATVSGLASGVRWLLEDDQRWLAASAASREFAVSHTLERQVDEVIGAYEALLQGR